MNKEFKQHKEIGYARLQRIKDINKQIKEIELQKNPDGAMPFQKPRAKKRKLLKNN